MLVPPVISTYVCLPYMIKITAIGIQIIGIKYHGVMVSFSTTGFPKKRTFLSIGKFTHSLYLLPKAITCPKMGCSQSTKLCSDQNDQKHESKITNTVLPSHLDCLQCQYHDLLFYTAVVSTKRLWSVELFAFFQ